MPLTHCCNACDTLDDRPRTIQPQLFECSVDERCALLRNGGVKAGITQSNPFEKLVFALCSASPPRRRKTGPRLEPLHASTLGRMARMHWTPTTRRGSCVALFISFGRGTQRAQHRGTRGALAQRMTTMRGRFSSFEAYDHCVRNEPLFPGGSEGVDRAKEVVD